jgi:hypothetical protein
MTAVAGYTKKFPRSGFHRQRPRRSTLAAILVPFRAQAGRSPVLCDRAAIAVGKTVERLKQQFAALVPEWGSDARMLKVVVIIRQSCGLRKISGDYRRYSRFRKTFTGDAVRSPLCAGGENRFR